MAVGSNQTSLGIKAANGVVITTEAEYRALADRASEAQWVDVSFLCVVNTQRRWSNKIYKTELTQTRYNNQVLGKYRVDPQRAGLTLIAELTWSNLGLKGVLNKRK